MFRLTPDDVVSPGGESANARINEFGEREVLKLEQGRRTFSEEEVAEMARLYQDGKTVYELAARFGAHRVTISRVLKEHGVKVTKRKGQAKLDVGVVIEMYGAYHTTGEIAKLYGVHPNCVVRCLREHGVAIRGRWDYPKK